jgi:hypothetical protein
LRRKNPSRKHGGCSEGNNSFIIEKGLTGVIPARQNGGAACKKKGKNFYSRSFLYHPELGGGEKTHITPVSSNGLRDRGRIWGDSGIHLC